MSEKDQKIADKLNERADAYQEPFGGSADWVQSQSYPIATALRELAIIFNHIDDEQH